MYPRIFSNSSIFNRQRNAESDNQYRDGRDAREAREYPRFLDPYLERNAEIVKSYPDERETRWIREYRQFVDQYSLK